LGGSDKGPTDNRYTWILDGSVNKHCYQPADRNGQKSWWWMAYVGNEVGTIGVRDAHDEPACKKDHGWKPRGRQRNQSDREPKTGWRIRNALEEELSNTYKSEFVKNVHGDGTIPLSTNQPAR
jgi:hypothetical protein